MKTIIIEFVTTFIGTLGFCIYFNIDKKRMIPAVLLATVVWGVYLACDLFTSSLFITNAVAAVFAGIAAEFMARKFKAPSTVFLIPGIIPLLPGGMLYYTMYALIDRDYTEFLEKGLETVYIIFGIALGILAASVLFSYIMIAIRKIKNKSV